MASTYPRILKMDVLANSQNLGELLQNLTDSDLIDRHVTLLQVTYDRSKMNSSQLASACLTELKDAANCQPLIYLIYRLHFKTTTMMTDGHKSLKILQRCVEIRYSKLTFLDIARFVYFCGPTKSGTLKLPYDFWDQLEAEEMDKDCYQAFLDVLDPECMVFFKNLGYTETGFLSRKRSAEVVEASTPDEAGEAKIPRNNEIGFGGIPDMPKDRSPSPDVRPSVSAEMALFKVKMQESNQICSTLLQNISEGDEESFGILDKFDMLAYFKFWFHRLYQSVRQMESRIR